MANGLVNRFVYPRIDSIPKMVTRSSMISNNTMQIVNRFVFPNTQTISSRVFTLQSSRVPIVSNLFLNPKTVFTTSTPFINKTISSYDRLKSVSSRESLRDININELTPTIVNSIFLNGIVPPSFAISSTPNLFQESFLISIS